MAKHEIKSDPDPEKHSRSKMRRDLVDGTFVRLAETWVCDDCENEDEPIEEGQWAFVVKRAELKREPGHTSCVPCATRLRDDDKKAIPGAVERAKLWAVVDDTNRKVG